MDKHTMAEQAYKNGYQVGKLEAINNIIVDLDNLLDTNKTLLDTLSHTNWYFGRRVREIVIKLRNKYVELQNDNNINIKDKI